MMILLGHTIIFSVALLLTTISADGADDEAQYEKAQKRFISTLVEKMDEIYAKSLPQRQKLMIKFMEDAVKGEGKGRRKQGFFNGSPALNTGQGQRSTPGAPFGRAPTGTGANGFFSRFIWGLGTSNYGRINPLFG